MLYSVHTHDTHSYGYEIMHIYTLYMYIKHNAISDATPSCNVNKASEYYTKHNTDAYNMYTWIFV